MEQTTTECVCEKCVGACHRKPGWFRFGEVEKAARLLGLSLPEFFAKYVGVDWWCESPKDVFVLAPAIQGKAGGAEYPGDPRGRCVFLTADDRCQIHAAKPYECAAYLHGEQEDVLGPRKAEIVNSWRSVKAQKQIQKLLGREPEAVDAPFSLLFGGFGF